jgi:alkylation response protein AidB-like acyl-CoA dehydrogenase
MSTEAIERWLEPLRAGLGATFAEWSRLGEFTEELDNVVNRLPGGLDLPAGPERSQWLLSVRRTLATVHGFADQPATTQLLAQFVCGYYDIDLRDTFGLGHGLLIARHGRSAARARWLPRLQAGELAGIAITEPHGGSRVRETRTHATSAVEGYRLITGRKCWISRLNEAAVFIVFFRDTTGRLAVAAVDATTSGLHRTAIQPTGLTGWSWGLLDLDHVPVHPDDVLEGEGMALLREHFATYRPWVAATAVGGAAAVLDVVTKYLTARDLPRLRDDALTALGRAHARITSALLHSLLASRLATEARQDSEMWSAAAKAHGVDAAYDTTTDLIPLAGAAGYRADSTIAETHRDLAGLRFADGIHDSLYEQCLESVDRPVRGVPSR